MCELPFGAGVCIGMLIGLAVNIIMDKWFYWNKELRKEYKKDGKI